GHRRAGSGPWNPHPHHPVSQDGTTGRPHGTAPPEAWDFEVGGVRVLQEWFATRVAAPEPGTLAAIRPATWPQTWTSELLELITVLALLAELRPLEGPEAPDPVTATELREAGVLPVPRGSRRPASVLEGPEEGPEGQLALL
ncbi:type ISP restriction/modification enzyme, partial [Streptomyces sp. NPDC002130]|uniref:type ISP restriction/modification enzyme n=1 Tax=Streptomyces sp. NPDC002130 TaxID=3155568 RepID=UPI003327100A